MCCVWVCNRDMENNTTHVNDITAELVEKLVSADGWRGENWTVDLDHAYQARITLETLRSIVMVG